MNRILYREQISPVGDPRVTPDSFRHSGLVPDLGVDLRVSNYPIWKCRCRRRVSATGTGIVSMEINIRAH